MIGIDESYMRPVGNGPGVNQNCREIVGGMFNATDSIRAYGKTGARVDVPSKRIPYFKPSKELKDLVNEGTGAPAAPAPEAPQTA